MRPRENENVPAGYRHRTIRVVTEARQTSAGWLRELLAEEIRPVLRPPVTEEEIQAVAERLLALPA